MWKQVAIDRRYITSVNGGYVQLEYVVRWGWMAIMPAGTLARSSNIG